MSTTHQTEIETILSQIADLARSHGLTADRIQARESAVYLDTIGFDRDGFKTLVRIANEIVTTIGLRFPHRAVGRSVQGGETAWFWRTGDDARGYRVGVGIKRTETEQAKALSGGLL